MKIEPIEELDENHDSFMPIVTNIRSLQPENESLKLIREAIEEIIESLAEKFKKESESELTEGNLKYFVNSIEACHFLIGKKASLRSIFQHLKFK